MGRINCSECEYSTFGDYDPTSDICDECMNNPDVGWGGFYDGRVGKHFNSEEERDKYYDEFVYDDDEDIGESYSFSNIEIDDDVINFGVSEDEANSLIEILSNEGCLTLSQLQELLNKGNSEKDTDDNDFMLLRL